MAETDAGGSSLFGAGGILPSILGLLGGVFSTYGQISQSREYNAAIRAAQKREQELYDRYAKETPADELKGIMQLKQGLSEQARFQIIQQITAEMSSRGLSASTGIVQEAIAEALVKAELPLFQMAIDSYYRGHQFPPSALPRTLPLPPQGGKGNPFQALVDIATNKKLMEGTFGGTDKTGGLPPFQGPVSPGDTSGGEQEVDTT